MLREMYLRYNGSGGMAEWSKATDLKSVKLQKGFVGSNPTPTATIEFELSPSPQGAGRSRRDCVPFAPEERVGTNLRKRLH